MVSEKLPKIASLNPVVMPGNYRVMMEMVVENLPNTSAGGGSVVNFFDTPPVTPDKSTRTAADSTVYPNVELSILNSQQQEIAGMLIVEHKEPHTSLTLHLRKPDVTEQYTARAEITYDNKTVDVVEIPFSLSQAN